MSKYKIIGLVLSFVIVLVLLYLYMPTGILVEPMMTPSEYLNSIPHLIIFNQWVLIVPSSTIIVALLGIQITLIGYLLIKEHKILWGTSLLFWGLGTLLAGMSYQGFGYELKCAGNPYCLFTSWFELSYLFVTAISIVVMAIAFAKDFMSKLKQKYLIRYALVALVTYIILLVMGSILENRVLISYEVFTIFFMPLFVVFFIINIVNYRQHKDQANKVFIKLWILFLIVNVLYYVYYIPGFTESLYENTGVWFSANDVLHVGLIGWFSFMVLSVRKQMTS
ncbi:MAG: hypothetical protein JXC31_00010 [Acholeplasmataceae bacterium]|nr:hypothetical protein [Acholeplasmataceae bacterium]